MCMHYTLIVAASCGLFSCSALFNVICLVGSALVLHYDHLFWVEGARYFGVPCVLSVIVLLTLLVSLVGYLYVL